MLIRSDARHIPLADGCVQCVVTSVPYWGLRRYAGEQEGVWGGDEGCAHQWMPMERGRRKDILPEDVTSLQCRIGTDDRQNGAGTNGGNFCQMCGAWRGAYGLEPTIDLYVQHTVEIFREVRRVLRPDGVCFLNIGDSYAANRSYQVVDNKHVDVGNNHGSRVTDGLKAKDLCLIPARVALALQADGWWVRSDIIWTKPNPMPESVTDRPTDGYEHILMLTKSARYYWDAEAVKEPATDEEYRTVGKIRPTAEGGPGFEIRAGLHNQVGGRLGRNLRNVWHFSTQPYSGSHFATFPEELVIRCIQAATSERGCCAECGAPWVRVVDRSVRFESGSGKAGNKPSGKWNGTAQTESGDYDIRMGPVIDTQTKGWRPACTHSAATLPCLVYDPFAGSGTVGLVAFSMGRRFILSDLAYQDLQLQRLPAMALVPGILTPQETL